MIPKNLLAFRFLAASLGQLGMVSEAAPAIAFLQKSRASTLAQIKEAMQVQYRVPEMISHVLDGLKKAGME
jgi:hypothetical protein